MARCEGIPTYTRRSVAWPLLPMPDGAVEVVLCSFQAKGGGVHSEFTFEWVQLGQRGDSRDGTLRLRVFSDGLDALLDERILDVLEALRLHRAREEGVSPEVLIAMLEAADVRPSVYHLHGLVEAASDDEKVEIEKQIRALRLHEEGRHDGD